MKSKSTTTILVILVLLGLTVFTSCKKPKDADPPSPKSTFKVKMGDSPAGYEAVNVEILKLNVNINGTWQEYAVANPGVYNLLQFTNGNTFILLGPTLVDPGSISEIRLILGDNNSIIVDGVTSVLQTPSGQTSGYKVKMGTQTLLAGITYSLVLDFDVNKSVHPTGNGKYMLKPVVNGYLETAIGMISGTVTPFTGAYYVRAFNATDTVGTYVAYPDGSFLISTLNPGVYTVHFYANAGFLDKEIAPVTVVAGQTTIIGNVIMDPVQLNK